MAQAALLAGATVLPIASVLAQTTSSVAVSQKPNIIYFFADDLGYGQVGAYGQEKIRTPHIDKLAAEGMKFTRHYAGAPLCSPSRASLLTGLHTGHTTVRFNYEFGGYTDETERGQMPLPPHAMTVGHLLQKAGYVTGCVGKWGLGMADTSGDPLRQGFDYFFGYLDQKQPHNYYPTHLWENGKKYPLKNLFVYVHERQHHKDANVDFAKYQQGDHAADHLTSKGLEFIASHRDQPFFLYFATPLPHLSLQPKKEFQEPYIAQFPNDKPYLGDKRYAPQQHPKAAYAAMITMMDAQLGALTTKLKELGLEDNTIVIFSSDNGPSTDRGGVDGEFFNSSGGLRGRKGSLYEGGIREPMIVRWPGKVAPGTTTDFASAQYDILPTLCEIAGVSPREPYDGVSLLPTLFGRPAEQKPHNYLYWEFPGGGGSQAVQQGDWKIVRTKVNGNPATPWELYNLKDDPGESTDLAAKHTDIVSRMAPLAAEAHWQPIISEWEFINPRKPVDPDRLSGAGGE